MKLKFIKDTIGIYNKPFKIGEVIEYKPWFFEYRGKTEAARIASGVYVFCYGHGEFDVFREGLDVIKVEE